MNVELAKIGVEYVILEGLERIVTSEVIRKLKVDLIEQKLIPAIAAHGDYLAGRSTIVGTSNRPKTDSSVVNHAIGQSMKHLGKVYHVKAAIYPTVKTIGVPGVAKLAKMRLPIAPEAPPSMTGTPANKYLKAWGNDKPVESDTTDPIAEIQKKMAENRKQTEDRIKELEQEIKFLEDLFNDVQDLKKRTGVDQDTSQEAQDEQVLRGRADEDRHGHLEEEDNARAAKERPRRDQGPAEEGRRSRQRTGKDPQQARQFERGREAPGPHRPEVPNRRHQRRHEPGRRAIHAVGAGHVSVRRRVSRPDPRHVSRNTWRSRERGEHYKKWTDRYTLTKSWQFRSGYRFRKGRRQKRANGTRTRRTSRSRCT